jgi:hypothetical protein
MEIVLRKASTLEKAAEATAAKIDLETTLKLSVHTIPLNLSLQMATEILSKASTAVNERIQSVIDLHEAASQIHKLAGVANQKRVEPNRSVDMLLDEKHLLDALEKIITGVLDTLPKQVTRRRSYDMDESTVRIGHDPQVVLNAVGSVRTRAATLTSGSVPDIEVSTLSDATVTQLRERVASIKRQRSDLMDELAAANLSQKIKLPDTVVATLRKHGIIE